MEKEKKIVRETIELQKRLIKFKDYCRNSQIESTSFTKLDIEIDRLKLKLIDTIIVAIEDKINNTLGNNKETNDFEVED